MTPTNREEECPWGSRRTFLMVLLCQTVGTSTFTALPIAAVEQGATGYIISYVLIFWFLGIPLLYMEFIVGQFTALNCLEIWKIRACFSHVGYVQIVWQFLYLIYNHTITSFVLHYFLISFEDPIPYYTCGNWSTPSCGILAFNFTLTQDCIKSRLMLPYCKDLFLTFSELQYWRYYILGGKQKYLHVAWRVSLASAITCIVVYFNCFKRKKSMKWFIVFLTTYPTIAYIVLMIGSMTQKGLVARYEQALDASFTVFWKKIRISNVILHVVYTLNIGSGISFNLAATTSFRAPCYSNIVITAVVCGAFTVVAVSTVAMMSCPYSYVYGISTTEVIGAPMTLNFEKAPRLLKQYEHKTFWLILNFSSNALLGVSTNVIILLSWLEIAAMKYRIVDKYPGLVSFAGTITLFVITTPLLGNVGVEAIFDSRKYLNFITVVLVAIESFVFVLWYGLHKFSEDVHFMQGIQPSGFLKLSWVLSSVVMAYVFCNELYHHRLISFTSVGEKLGWYALLSLVALIFLVAVLKIVTAMCKKKLHDCLKPSPSWGPRNEVLLRSRAMFSAQAMTKEYMYRQYHLQAGIQARQRASNRRRDVAGSSATTATAATTAPNP